MRALILAAGLGTRLMPLTKMIPKCLAPINGHPLLGYWLAQLEAAGVTEILINLHHFSEQVVEYVEHSPYASLVSFSYEPELLGTAGTVLKHKDWCEREPLLLIHGDNLSCFDLPAFQQTFERRPDNVVMTMMSFFTDTPSSCGILELDENGVVQGFFEKHVDPPGHLANGAIYILDAAVLEYMASLKQTQLDFSQDVIPAFLGQINVWHNGVYHRDIGSVDSLIQAQQEVPSSAIVPAANSWWEEFWSDADCERTEYCAQLLADSRDRL